MWMNEQLLAWFVISKILSTNIDISW